MIVRCAYFEGTVDEKDREKFKQTIVDLVVPTMEKFPGVRDVRVLWSREIEEGAPEYFMVLQHFYDSLEALHSALESEVRTEVWEGLNQIMPLFDGRVVHINYEVSGL